MTAAPECYIGVESERRCDTTITRKADIWSMGCVILVLATWTTHGIEGVKKFREARKAENDAIHSKASERFHDGTSPSVAELKSGAPGIPRRLESVERQLLQVSKDVNEVTASILELAEWMIRSSPDSRPTIQVCVEAMQRTLDTAEAQSCGDRQRDTDSDTSGHSGTTAVSSVSQGSAFREQYQTTKRATNRAGPSQGSKRTQASSKNFSDLAFMKDMDTMTTPRTGSTPGADITAHMSKSGMVVADAAAQRSWSGTSEPCQNHRLSRSELPRPSKSLSLIDKSSGSLFAAPSRIPISVSRKSQNDNLEVKRRNPPMGTRDERI